jgi:hypothetical protein
VVGSILKDNMTEPTTESGKSLALPHLVAAIETKSQMAKDWRLPEYFRDTYRRDAVALHYAYIKLGEAMMLAQITSAPAEDYESQRSIYRL